MANALETLSDYESLARHWIHPSCPVNGGVPQLFMSPAALFQVNNTPYKSDTSGEKNHATTSKTKSLRVSMVQGWVLRKPMVQLYSQMRPWEDFGRVVASCEVFLPGYQS